MQKIILASASPRRRALLEQLDIDYVVHPSMAPEVMTGDSVNDIVRHLARQKASWVIDDISADDFPPNTIVLGADTVVTYEGRILGKPADRDDAYRMLKMLSGQIHEVYTGVSMLSLDGAIDISFAESTKVKFYDLSEQEIQDYLDTDEPYDKAGSYGIQGLGAALVEGIEGDYNNVVGLPVARVYRELSKIYK